MFIDSHAHIHMLVKEKGCQISEIIDEMKENNVYAVANICGNENEFLFSQQIQNVFLDSGISFFSVAGFHPHEAEKFIDSPTRWISDNSDAITAVGEIGLDFYYDFSPRETQRKMLRKMIDLSLELQKPLIIHG
ncbi:MAG TPA: TatD family hydrolase, partial [bacterium]|nr:TatD family hydrolase [bacterium]